MKKRLLVLGAASLFALSGCHGLSKVDYAKFKEKVDALEEVKCKQVKISGKIEGEKVKLTYDIPQTAGAGLDSALDALSGKYNKYELEAISVATAEKTPAYYTVSEDEKLTYYTGMGFKVVTPDAKYEYSGKGFLASVKGKINGTEYNFSVSYKFVK